MTSQPEKQSTYRAISSLSQCAGQASAIVFGVYDMSVATRLTLGSVRALSRRPLSAQASRYLPSHGSGSTTVQRRCITVQALDEKKGSTPLVIHGQQW